MQTFYIYRYRIPYARRCCNSVSGRTRLPADIWNTFAYNVRSALRRQVMRRRRDSVAVKLRHFVGYHRLNFLLRILLEICET